MSEVLVTSATDHGDDLLVVDGYVNGQYVRATGWVSALTNHYDPESYLEPDEHGNTHRGPGVKARALTEEEARAYCVGLLLAAAGVVEARPLPLAIPLDPEPTLPPATG